MEFKVNLNLSRAKSTMEALKKFPEEILDGGSQAIYDYLVEYHSRIDWREGNWFAGPGSGEFQKSVVEGWQPPVRSGNTITIKNTFGLLSWKTTGGIITPRRATHLTIPLISEARHRSVAEFRASTGDRLFRAGDALCRKIGKKIEAVYALSLGVKQNPYPNALPSKHDLWEVIRGVADGLVRRL